LAGLLAGAGFAAELVPFGEGRAQLLARIGGKADRLPLGFTGHLDTVPLGAQPWSVDPFAAEIADGKLYGRGSSDMKAGVAAFVTACLALADRLAATPGVLLVITASEETGCSGAEALVAAGSRLGRVGALVVAEPTGNRPLVGHKGALWLEAETKGVTAHGSMPEKGVNAVYKAARAVAALQTSAWPVTMCLALQRSISAPSRAASTSIRFPTGSCVTRLRRGRWWSMNQYKFLIAIHEDRGASDFVALKYGLPALPL
jgi:succinyl-diaminopimelate desuccinylase